MKAVTDSWTDAMLSSFWAGARDTDDKTPASDSRYTKYHFDGHGSETVWDKVKWGPHYKDREAHDTRLAYMSGRLAYAVAPYNANEKPSA